MTFSRHVSIDASAASRTAARDASAVSRSRVDSAAARASRSSPSTLEASSSAAFLTRFASARSSATARRSSASSSRRSRRSASWSASRRRNASSRSARSRSTPRPRRRRRRPLALRLLRELGSETRQLQALLLHSPRGLLRLAPKRLQTRLRRLHRRADARELPRLRLRRRRRLRDAAVRLRQRLAAPRHLRLVDPHPRERPLESLALGEALRDRGAPRVGVLLEAANLRDGGGFPRRELVENRLAATLQLRALEVRVRSLALERVRRARGGSLARRGVALGRLQRVDLRLRLVADLRRGVLGVPRGVLSLGQSALRRGDRREGGLALADVALERGEARARRASRSASAARIRRADSWTADEEASEAFAASSRSRADSSRTRADSARASSSSRRAAMSAVVGETGSEEAGSEEAGVRRGRASVPGIVVAASPSAAEGGPAERVVDVSAHPTGLARPAGVARAGVSSASSARRSHCAAGGEGGRRWGGGGRGEASGG